MLAKTIEAVVWECNKWNGTWRNRRKKVRRKNETRHKSIDERNDSILDTWSIKNEDEVKRISAEWH